jgi:hypothetical protein
MARRRDRTAEFDEKNVEAGDEIIQNEWQVKRLASRTIGIDPSVPIQAGFIVAAS